MDFVCPICKAQFHLKPYHVKRFKGPFCCSRKCRGEFIKNEYSGENNPNFRYKTEAQKAFAIKTTDIKRRSRHKSIKFDLEDNFLYELYNKQKGLCHYTNIPMKLTTDDFKNKGQADLEVVSVDKIDPDQGYTMSNVVLCCSGINKLKGSASVEDLKFFLNAIANRYKNESKD